MESIFKDKTHVIFDFDGTIADTFSLHEAAFEQALKSYHLDFSYCDYLGMSTNEAIARIFKSNEKSLDNEEFQRLVKRKRLLANQSYKASLQALPDVLDFITLLHQHGVMLFVASSGSKMNVTTGLKTLHIDPYFTDIFTSEDVKKSKPDPEIFQIVLDRYNIAPACALVIEDAASGVEAANAAGIDVICVNPELSCHPVLGNTTKCLGFAKLIKEFEILHPA